MICQHCKTPIGLVRGLSKEELKAIRSKRTDGDSQNARILAALRTGPKTTDDFRALGIYQSAARINGLRKRQYVIETALYDGYSADGYSHAKLGRYTLIEEPLPDDPKRVREGPKSGKEDGEAQCS